MKINVVLGPTSIGKTSLALKLCKELGGEIISADSRQVYKYMDIGTGKLPVDLGTPIKKGDKYWEIDDVKVWGYDLVTPNDYFSSYDFAQFALERIPEIIATGKKVFLVGGTGFYIDMVTGRIKPAGTPPDFELRGELDQLSLEELQNRLEKLNPSEFSKIDKYNPARLVRAIEKHISGSGRSNKTNEIKTLNYLKNAEFTFLGLTADRRILYEKADLWLDKVWQRGLIKETRSLLNSEFADSPKLKGLVYKTAVDFINGEVKEEEAKQKAKYDLHAYIRRQQTYFKKMPGINWLDVLQDNKLQKVYNILNG